MDSKGSIPHSQGPTTGPYPDPDVSAPHLSNLLPSFYYYPTIYAKVF